MTTTHEQLLASLNHSVYADGWRKRHEYVAMILEQDFVIIPKSDLADVKRTEHDPNAYRVDGESVVFTSLENAEMWVMRDVAVWQFIKAEGTALDVRRNELAQEFSTECDASQSTYSGSNLMFRRAIDRIIELEAAA